MTRHLKIAAACLLACLLIPPDAAIAQGAPTAGLRPVTFMVSDPTLTVGLIFLMKSKGFDKAHGIDVILSRTGNSSSLQLDAVIAGHADFGAPGTQTALQAMRGGADLKIVASVSNNQLAAVLSLAALKKVNVAPDAPIADRIRAMKGMTIATNPVGATYYQMFRAYLKQYGVDPDKDVRLVPLGEPTAMLSGIQYGRYDAVVSAAGIVEQAIGLNAAAMWFSGASGDLPNADSTIVCVVVARSEVVEKQPEKVVALRAALTDTLNFIRTDRAAAGQLLKAEYFPRFDAAVWKTVWDSATEAYPSRPTVPAQRLRILDWYRSEGAGKLQEPGLWQADLWAGATALKTAVQSTGSQRNPSPQRVIRTREGEGKCAVQQRVEVSQYRSRKARLVWQASA